MPRNNPLKAMDTETLAIQYVIRLDPENFGPAPVKMYSVQDIWEELMKRSDGNIDTAHGHLGQASETLKLLG